MAAQEALPDGMREAESDVCSIAHERAATKQTAGKAPAHPGFDDMAPAAALLALRICTSYSTRLAPCIRGHIVRNAAHGGFCIRLLGRESGTIASMLDPDIRRLLDTVLNVPPDSGAPNVAQLRAAAEAAPKLLGGEAEPVASIRDMRASGPAGPVPVRVYRPESPAPLPLVLYAHGGGWVTGSLDSHDKLCRMLANRLGAVVVAVDYRLAPEHAFPAALDDVEAAWHWTRAEAQALGADGMRFAVAGDSSGGNLVAALTLRLARAGAAQPQAQLLFYPALDAACARASYREFASGYNLSGTQMAWYWNAYSAGAAPSAPELSPLAEERLSGLPPAVIALAGADVLRDDGLDYARRLQDAGVPVRVVDCTGTIHGFLRWTGEVPAARSWIDAIAAAARELPAFRPA